jgi:secondary thiamine-phosphate synthase enzyme
MVKHIDIVLAPQKRGFHPITEELLSKLPALPETGILQLFIRHTSASLTINENADPNVKHDMEEFYNRIVPENQPFLKHTMEGPDDMPAHVKVAMTGSHLSIPIINGRLHLGTWQGIFLCEFRNHGGSRKITASVIT